VNTYWDIEIIGSHKDFGLFLVGALVGARPGAGLVFCISSFLNYGYFIHI
jgi:hypothetical protein